jgi:hypothetical protein
LSFVNHLGLSDIGQEREFPAVALNSTDIYSKSVTTVTGSEEMLVMDLNGIWKTGDNTELDKRKGKARSTEELLKA